MVKKIFAVVAVMSFCVVSFSMAAEQKKPAEPAKMYSPTKPMPMPKSAFSMVGGTITKIDNSDPANVKLEVKNDMDQTTHTISVTPWANVTKVTDASELKVGDAVRVMTRKSDDKEVAMGIMFGKVQNPPMVRPIATPAQQPKK